MYMKNNKIDLEYLKSLLGYLDISDLARKVFLYLLPNSESTITNLAQQFKVNRTQIYHTLDELADRHLIIKNPGFSRNFKVSDLSNLKKLLEVQMDQNILRAKSMDTLIQNFDRLFVSDSQLITTYTTKESLRKLFVDIYTTELNHIVFVGDAARFAQYLGDDYILYNVSKRERKKVSHTIYSPTVAPKNDFLSQTINRVEKVISLSSPACLHLLSDSVVFWNLDSDSAIWLRDRVYSEILQSILSNG
jgi:predicted transcriptional regulator